MQPQQKIETLLNDIYSQPDLKGGVYQYIQRHVLKVYGLLKADQLNIENGQPEKVLFNDSEKKHRLESIIYRDLPSIIDIYKKMPLEYRNEHKIKNGKTHREQLLDNLELLTEKLSSLENSAYEAYDYTMAAKTRAFKEIYKDDFINGATQQEKETLKAIDDYQWKKPSPEMEKSFNFFTKENAATYNEKIVLREDTIEYKVDKKFKHFMEGTYNVFKIAGQALIQAPGMVGRMIFGNSDEGDEMLMTALFRLSMGGTALVAVGASIVFPMQYFAERPAYHLITASQKINLENDKFREISLNVLESYAKENNVKYEYSPNKDSVSLSVLESKRQCMVGFGAINRSGLKYFNVNGVEMTKSNAINYEIAEGVCKPDNNVMKVTMKLK